jgi:flagellar assembly protein FliH
MIGAKPFLFDRDFDGRRRSEEMVPMTQHLATISECEQRAFAAGAAEGRHIALDEQPARLNSVLEKLAVHVSLEIARSEARAMAQELGAIELALELARKLAGRAIDRYPASVIESAVHECFTEARTAPHVAVRVHESLVEEVKAHLGALAADRGFAGKLIILGEPEIAPGDVRLEWADGGVVRERAAIEQAIEKTIHNHIASVESSAREGDER